MVSSAVVTLSAIDRRNVLKQKLLLELMLNFMLNLVLKSMLKPMLKPRLKIVLELGWCFDAPRPFIATSGLFLPLALATHHATPFTDRKSVV